MRRANFYFSLLLIFLFIFCKNTFAENLFLTDNPINHTSGIEDVNCSFTLSANITDADCQSGSGIGEIDLTVTGATGMVTYNWSNGETTEDITTLDAGIYAVTVSDGSGCETVEYYQVSSGTGQEVFDYYVPLTEADIHSYFYNFTSVWIPYFYLSNNINTILSIVVTDDNTIITYDHWEDGQEWNISNPSNGSTQIWGDGDASNGIPPGFSVDILNAGDAINLENKVYLPRSASSLKYDGRDHISSSAQLAVSRAAWGPEPGPVLSGAIEILEKNAYGKEFQIPVGEDVASDDMFEYVGLSVMASENFTLVRIDTDGNGSTDKTKILNKGESYFVNGGIQTGATITATRPVQAHLLTGDIYALFEARWFTLFPNDLWDNCYYNPIGTTVATDPSDVFVYNPHGSSLTVFYESQLGTGNFSIPSKGTYRYRMPLNSGAHFYTQNNKEFFAISTIDSDVQNDNDAHDWGFSLMPENYLTVSATIGFGPGNNGLTGNGSPAWVTSTESTTLYVDYDGDPTTGALIDDAGDRYDVSYDVAAFESRRIFDPNDNDQTGMYIYTLDGTLIAVAWGQDPATADPGNPYLDFGTAVPPIRKITGWKDYVLMTDADSDGKVDPGDVLEFRLHLQNSGNSPVTGITVTDELPDEITYISGTSALNGSSISDGNSGTVFPIDEFGFYISSIPVNETYIITYQTTVNPMPPVYNEIVNEFTAFITDPCKTIKGEIRVPVETPPATSSCDLFLANVGGGAVSSFQINSDVCFQLTDADQNLNGSGADMVSVTLENGTTNDTETIILTETGNSTGIFTGCISSSTILGTSDEDGTFYATEGSSISSSYTDGTNGDMCSDNAVFEAESFIKQLYLSETNALDRVDPVSTNDNTTSVSINMPAASVEGTISIKPSSGDMTIQSGNPTANGGNIITLLLGQLSGANELRNFIEFDLSSIPEGQQINSANFIFEINGPATSPIPFQIDVHRVTSPWDEGTDTWNTVNSAFDSNIESSITVEASGGTYSLDITNLVRRWHDGTYPNYGFLLKANNPVDEEYVWIASKEHGTTSIRPELSLNYGTKDVIQNGDFESGTDITFSTTDNWEDLFPGSDLNVRHTTYAYAGSYRGIVGSATQPYQNTGHIIEWGESYNLSMYHTASANWVAGVDEFNAVIFYEDNSTRVFLDTLTLSPTQDQTVGYDYFTGSYSPITDPAAVGKELQFALVSIAGASKWCAIDEISLTVNSQFVQSSPMCSDLNMPAGGAITVKTYINDLADNLPVSPNVTAVLKNDGNTFATLSNPTFTGSTSVGYGSAVVDMGGGVGHNDILGAPDDVGGQLYNDNDYVTLELPVELPAGTNYSVYPRIACVGDPLYYQIEESSDNSTFYVHSSSPRTEPSAWFTEHSYTAEHPTKYIRITKTAGACIQFDAVKFTLISSGNLLTWTGVLPGDVTIGSGESVSLEVTNNESGSSFQILYDSETYPSQINLPTTSVIKIEDFTIYDAAYPGGTEISEFQSDGSTVYLRATASDPFGTEDITEIDFEIAAPGGGIDNYDGIAVDSSGCEKTFEYAWTIPSATGQYKLNVYAKEGYEQTVIDTVRTTVTVDPPDPTAPCDLTFIDQSGNPSPNFVIDNTICIRLEDSNTNKDDNVVESVVVTLTTNSGDSELINLIETDPGSGVFENCIPSSSSSGTNTNNGTLDAVEDDVINITHLVDDEDCSAFANVLAKPAQIKVLYLSEPGQGMDRIDPVSTNDLTTSYSGALTTAAGTTNINVSEDAHLQDSSPDNNYGFFSNFQAGPFSGGTKEWRSLLKFDVSSLTPGDVGTVNLVIEMKSAYNAPVPVEVYKLDTDWAEGTVTWNSPWTTPGGDFGATLYGTETVQNSFTIGDPKQFLTINITGLVREWVNGTSPNYGLLLSVDAINSSINCNAREAGGGTDPYLEVISANTQNFEMDASLCRPLTILNGETVTVEANVNVLSGTMPANPDITAGLYINDNSDNWESNIMTIVNPTYAGGKLTWTGALSGGNADVDNAKRIGLEISNNESGVNFEVAYDSKDFPSAVNLPTNTVIEIDYLNTHEGFYPDFTATDDATSGDSIVILTSVGDPFGAYDIRYLDLKITSPAGNETVVRLDDDDTVDAVTGQCLKTYEYLWIAPEEEGEFTIKAIAQEGYESVQDSLITSIIVTQTDLGTNCVIEFLDNSDMNRTSFDPNEQICLQISDFDKNTDTTSVENVIVTLESDAGDFETMLLAETGVNTGVFKACINSSATISGTDEDGQIFAPSTSILTGEYYDTADSSDVCIQQVSINSLVPAVAINKTLTSPSDGNALPGELVTFNLNISNPGPTELTDVFVGDAFDDVCLDFVSASVLPDYTSTDSLNWTNIGPIASGTSQNISVTFSAEAACNPALNIANTSAVDENSAAVSAGPDTAQLIIANPEITVTKTIIAPVAANILVGDQVTYEIQITNTGNTTITSLPVYDTYSNFCQSYISASIVPDDIGGGTLLWNNMGPLAPGGVLTFTVVLEAVNPCSPASNIVEIFFAEDQYGNTVPPVTDDAEIPVIVPPIAIDDYEVTTVGVPVTIQVPDNDYDFNFDLDVTSVQMTGLLQPDDGTITSIDGVTGFIIYTPDLGFVGNDTFEYQICDLTALCDTATVFITIEMPPEEICGDGIDNDGDGFKDCEDSECEVPVLLSVTSSDPSCPFLNNGEILIGASGNYLEYSIDNGLTYQATGVFSNLVPGTYEVVIRNSDTGCEVSYMSNPIVFSNTSCPEICNDGIDNDGDGDIDCADGDCANLTLTVTNDTTICDGDSKFIEVETVNCANTCSSTLITSFPYSQSFENTYGGWTADSGNDFDWLNFSGSTASSNTGPSSAVDGSWYIYMEVSSPNYPTKSSTIESPCFDLLDYGGAQMDFQYHMYGPNVGTLNVDVSIDDGNNWTTVWTRTGNQGNSWLSASVNLSAYVGNIIKIRLAGTSGASWNGDIAIDDFSISVSDYTYLWTGGATTSSTTVSPSSTTTYFVTVTNGAGTETVNSVTITVAPCVEICGDNLDNDGDMLIDCDDGDCGTPTINSVTPSNPDNCPDLDNGSIIVSANGVNLEYSINNGSSFQSSNTFSDLLAGAYYIIVRNSSSGCETAFAGNPVIISDPVCVEICGDLLDNDGDGDTDCDDEDCSGSLNIAGDPNGGVCGGSGGTIDLTVSGTAPFTYVWDDMTPDAQWNFDNSNTDISGNGNDPHISGSRGVLTYSGSSQEGTHAAYFDGTDYVRYSIDGNFMEVAFTYMTFSTWIKPDNLTGVKYIFDEGGGTNGIALRINGNTLEGAVRNGKAQFNAGSLVIPNDGNWHHVAMVFDSGDFTIYLDGASGTTTTASYSTVNGHSGNGGLGYLDGGSGFGSGSGTYFVGYMDDARYFADRALTDNQILDMARNDGDRTALAEGTYTVTVTNGSDCKLTDTNVSVVSNTQNITDAGSVGSDQTICSGEVPAAFTNEASASGGNGGPITYQWESSTDQSNWNDLSGETGATYAPGALTQTTYYRRRASRNGCPSVLNSNILTITVVDNLTAPGAISGEEIQCGSYNPGVISSVAPATGGSGGTLEYQWQSSLDGSTGWVNISGAIGESFDPPVVAVSTYFRRCARRSPCSDYVHTTPVLKAVVLNYNSGGQIQANESECLAYDPAIITEVTAPSGGAGGNLEYTWQENVNNGGWVTISGEISDSYDPPMLLQTTEYRRGARRSPCGDFVYSNTVTKAIMNGTSGTISTYPVGTNGYLCENTGYSFAATDAGAGASYSWEFGTYANPTTAVGQGPHVVSFDVPDLDNSTKVKVVLNTSLGACVSTDTIELDIRPELKIANVNGNNPTECGIADGDLTFFISGPTGADFEISIDGGMTWGATNQTTFTGLGAGTYQVQLRYINEDCFVDWGVVALEDPFLPTSAIFQNYGSECMGDSLEFEALFNFFIGSYSWNFGAGASPATATGRGPHFVSYSGSGAKNVTLTVSGFGCSKDYNEIFNISENYSTPGSIGSDQDLCGTFDPAELISSASPTGGTAGVADYQWDSRVDDGSGSWGNWSEIVGATSDSYDPPVIAEPTQFRRKARNLPCTDWLFSNIVTVTPSGTPTAFGDTYSSVCPGNSFGEDLTLNDVNIVNPVFTIHTQPTNGILTIFEDGQFLYAPNSAFCGTDQFIYEVCNSGGVCCDTAIVNLNLTDSQDPVFTNIPADITLSCDEIIPVPPSVVAIENCLSVSISFDEISTQGINGCSLNDYQLTRIWTATDYCGNSTSDEQIVTVDDATAPDIYRIYTLPNGKKMVAGVMENVSHNWKQITLPVTFPTTPVIFTQLTTDDDNAAANVRLRNISTSQFEMKLSEEEASDDLHGRESVAWIAIEEGVHSGMNSGFEVASLTLTDAVTNHSFYNDMGANPGLLSSVQTYVETDPAHIVFENLSGTGVDLNLMEETSVDPETGHLDETAAYMVLQSQGDFKLASGEVIGESGMSNITTAWTTVNFIHNYTNPVVIANTPTSNDNEPVQVRIKDITDSDFKIKLQEWDYQDGSHLAEEVTWFVVEGSIPFDIEVSCDLIPDALEQGTELVAVDNCDFTVELIFNETLNTNNCAPGNVISRSWSASDDCGNAVMISRNISVIDTVAPTFTVPPNIVLSCLEDIDDLVRAGDVTDEADNCSSDLEATYSDVFNGPLNCDSVYTVIRNWSLTDDCGNTIMKTQLIHLQLEGINLALKVKLQGAMYFNFGDPLMRDDLRKQGLIPLKEPYAAIPSFAHRNEGGAEALNPSVFDVEGQDAIVDWVFVELRDQVKPDSVVGTRSGLLQRDGDIVDLDGFSALAFNTIPGGSYFVSVRHRNHLGIMTANPVTIANSVAEVVDFTSPDLVCYGTHARRNDGMGGMEMWGGDFNSDGKTVSQGFGNDASDLALSVFLDEYNTGFLPNFIVRSYELGDFDLNGQTIFQGPDNDRAKMQFFVVLDHPDNTLPLANFVVYEQLP